MSKQSDLVSVSQGSGGDPLYIDTTNDRVGVGTTSPEGKLDIALSSMDIVAGLGGDYPMFTYRNGSGSWFHAGKSPTDDAFIISTGATPTATERMRIDSAGRVTMPYQPAFKAGRSTNYAPGANATIVFNDTSNTSVGHFNIGNHYNTTNGRFTAPISGRYIFTALVIYQDLSNGQAADDVFYIRRNGNTATYSFRRAEYVDGTTGNLGYYTDHANVILNLSAGDYVTVDNGRFNLTVHGNTAYTWFAGYLLG